MSRPLIAGLLNAVDFRLLHIGVAPKTAAPVASIPVVLTQNRFPTEADLTARWRMSIDRVGPPNREFAFDGRYFDMKKINHAVELGAVEAWTIENDLTFRGCSGQAGGRLFLAAGGGSPRRGRAREVIAGPGRGL